MTKSITYTLSDTKEIAQKVLEKLAEKKIITFTGSLGAGKTTLIQELAKLLGVNEPVTSPTFAYLNEYKAGNGKRIYHFDLYRIGSINDFLGAGFDEYLLLPDALVFIEWPEHVLSLLGDSALHVALDYHDDHAKRVITIA